MAARQIFDGVWVGSSTDRKPGFPTARSGNIFFERDTKAIYVLLQQWTQFGGSGGGSTDVAWPDITGDQSTVNLSGFNNDAGFLTSFTETDPVFGASPAAGITPTQIGNWDVAFGWGNHATQGYLTAEANDLTAAVTWANVPDANITQSSVVQHEDALSIDADNIVADNTPTDGQVLSFDATSGNLLWVDPQVASSALALTSISPTSGDEVGGTAVTLTVENADTSASATVDFGTDPATNVVVVSSTEITCDSPAGTGTVDVTVTQGSDSATLAGAFEYTAAGAWTPADITTLFWLDGKDGDTITLDGSSNVEQWDDKSGNAYNAANTNASSRPSPSTDRVSFNGTDQYLKVDSGLSATQPFSVFIVYDGIDKTDRQFIYDGLSGRTILSPDNSGNFGIWAGTWLSSGFGEFWDIGLFSGIYNGASSETFLNGAAGATGNPGSNDLTGGFILGSNNTINGITWVKGDICEFIILNRNPTTDEREKLEGYLAHKWGFETNLPSGHPYKSSPP